MRDELDVVRDVSARFASAAIGFMLTGSMAMNYEVYLLHWLQELGLSHLWQQAVHD